jgi:hypothetical protein
VLVDCDGAFDMAGDEKRLARDDVALDANGLPDASGHFHLFDLREMLRVSYRRIGTKSLP